MALLQEDRFHLVTNIGRYFKCGCVGDTCASSADKSCRANGVNSAVLPFYSTTANRASGNIIYSFDIVRVLVPAHLLRESQFPGRRSLT